MINLNYHRSSTRVFDFTYFFNGFDNKSGINLRGLCEDGLKVQDGLCDFEAFMPTYHKPVIMHKMREAINRL